MTFYVMTTAANAEGLGFGALLCKLPPSSEIPTLEMYDARDGVKLPYRHYRSDSHVALILVHGSGTSSQYLSCMSGAIAKSGAAAVYTPDLRGHGASPIRRGDIDYADQLVDDLADLVSHIRAANDDIITVVVGGHSSGGGLTVRFADSLHKRLAGAFLMLAPYLGYGAPTTRKNSGGWAEPNLFKIIPISMLNAIGIRGLNGIHVLHFNMPPEYRDGSETLSCSYRLMEGFGPSDFRTALESVEVPLLLLVGSKDNALFADRFEPTLRPLLSQAVIKSIDGASHLGLVVDDAAIDAVCRWLKSLP